MPPRLSRILGCGCGLIIIFLIIFIGAMTGFQRQNLRAWWNSLRAIVAQPEYMSGLAEADEILDYIREHPDDVALISYSLQTDGRPDPTAPIIVHNPDELMPLAGLNQLILLALYTSQVVAGELDPTEAIPLSAWEAYYLPNTDGQAHSQMLNELNLVADAPQTVRLAQIVRAMIRYNDHAATDYLLARFGPAQVEAFLEAQEALRGLGSVISPLGLFLSWRNHETPTQDEIQLAALSSLSESDYLRKIENWKVAYQDQAWREAERQWRRSAGRIADISYEAPLAAATVRHGQAQAYAHLMAGVLQGSFISPEVSSLMAQYLTWPLETPELETQFITIGTKGVALPGIINEATYYLPRHGDFAEQPRITVLFMRNLPLSAFLQLRNTFGHQKFVIALATKRDFAKQVAEALRD